LQIDKLEKYNLIDKAAVSWNSFDFTLNERNLDVSFGEYNWKYWKPKIQLLDQIKDINAGWTNQIPEQYYYSFAHLVTEATIYSYFITEKTVPALRLLKPFIISSRKGIHKLLKEKLGFELYDEVFDYEFDSVDDHDTRFDLIAQNMKKLSEHSKSDLQTLYKKIYPKLVYNQQQYTSVIKNIDLIHPFILDLCKNHKEIVSRHNSIYHHYLHCKDN
jgi:hypothetical protein